MDRDYNFDFTAPGGNSKASADGLENLKMFLPAGIVNGVQPKEQQRGPSLDSLARDTLELLRLHLLESRTRGTHTSISKAGMELFLIKCYLRGMTVKGTMVWLRKNRGFKASQSAVGRYWKLLREAKISPAKERISG